jgi:hypothetical protein
MTSTGARSNLALYPSPQAGFLRGLAFGLAALAVGCGEEAGRSTNARNYAQSAATPKNSVVSSDAFAAMAGSPQPQDRAAAPVDAQSQVDATRQTPAQSARKIIYEGRIDLKVDSLASTQQAVLRLVDEHGGFLSDSDQSSLTDAQPHASWKVRVPVDRFRPLVAAVARLGEVRQNRVSSQDVTEEFFDVEARIRNKQEEEKRLLKILSDVTGKLKDILEIERELSRVRGEVERVQGRLRFLANQTELSTLTIDATEWKDYQPPIAPTFVTVMGRTFFDSIENLTTLGKGVLLFLIAITPWLPFIVVGSLVLRWLIRWLSRWGRVPIEVRLRPTNSSAPIS